MGWGGRVRERTTKIAVVEQGNGGQLDDAGYASARRGGVSGGGHD